MDHVFVSMTWRRWVAIVAALVLSVSMLAIATSPARAQDGAAEPDVVDEVVESVTTDEAAVSDAQEEPAEPGAAEETVEPEADELIESAKPLHLNTTDLDGRNGAAGVTYKAYGPGGKLEGSLNQWNKWESVDEVAKGEYTVHLETPEGTHAVVSTDAPDWGTTVEQTGVNKFKVTVNTILANSPMSSVGAQFQLVESAKPLHLNTSDLDGRNGAEGVTYEVATHAGDPLAGALDEYNMWRSENPVTGGHYRVTINTPEDTAAVVDTTTTDWGTKITFLGQNQYMVTVDPIDMASPLSSVGAQFKLIERAKPLNLNTIGLDGRRGADGVSYVAQDADGNDVAGMLDQYNMWRSDEPIVAGVYNVVLTTPEGTVAVVDNDAPAWGTTVVQTDENTFTVTVDPIDMSSPLSSVGVVFKLQPTPDEPVVPDPDEPVDPDPDEPIVPDPTEPDPTTPVDPDPTTPVDPDPTVPADPDPTAPADTTVIPAEKADTVVPKTGDTNMTPIVGGIVFVGLAAILGSIMVLRRNR